MGNKFTKDQCEGLPNYEEATKHLNLKKFKLKNEKEILEFTDFDFSFYWNFDTHYGNPSLEAALFYFEKSGCYVFGKLPFEILWLIFTIKQDMEIVEVINSIKDRRNLKFGRLELISFSNNVNVIKFRLTQNHFHARERVILRKECLTLPYLKLIFSEYKDLMHFVMK